jgi:hypothetical protein
VGWAMSQASLAKEVLAELPSQLVCWMRNHDIAAMPPIQVDDVQLMSAIPVENSVHGIQPPPEISFSTDKASFSNT